MAKINSTKYQSSKIVLSLKAMYSKVKCCVTVVVVVVVVYHSICRGEFINRSIEIRNQ